MKSRVAITLKVPLLFLQAQVVLPHATGGPPARLLLLPGIVDSACRWWQLCTVTFDNVGIPGTCRYGQDCRTAGSLVIMRPGGLKSMSQTLSSASNHPLKAKIRIVVADDHPIFRDGLCKLLDVEEDLEVVAQADDGLEVLGLLQRYEPDILLLDLRMPDR